jgi:hypothetical protein
VQGQWILRSYLEAIAAGADKAFVFMLRDANAANPNKYNSSGLTTEIWYGQEPKKSWYYVSTMKNQLKGLRFESEITSGHDSVNIYKFTSTSCSTNVYAVWCTSSSNKIIGDFTLDIGPSAAARMSVPQYGMPDGYQSVLEIQNNTVTFRVTERPVFILSMQDTSLLPGAAGPVSGTLAVQQGQAGVNYWVNPVANATGYNWTLPPGATITAGANTHNITVTFSSTARSGNLVVSGTNLCGSGQASPVQWIHVVPTQNNLNNVILENGETKCYDAGQDVNVAGNGTTFLVQSGGSATLIAGRKIILLPGTKVEHEAMLRAYITNTGAFCNTVTAPPKKGENISFEQTPTIQSQAGMFKIYPNPTIGKFTLELNPGVDPAAMTMFINGMRGEIVIKQEVEAIRKKEFSIEEKQAGIYIIRLIMGDRVEMAKIIRL